MKRYRRATDQLPLGIKLLYALGLVLLCIFFLYCAPKQATAASAIAQSNAICDEMEKQRASLAAQETTAIKSCTPIPPFDECF